MTTDGLMWALSTMPFKAVNIKRLEGYSGMETYDAGEFSSATTETSIITQR